MSNLTILKWSGGKREVHFVGYNRDHTACFIRDEQNVRRAITLRLPKLFDIRFHENPIGKGGSPPIEINRAALHLPACFASQKEKEVFDDLHSTEVQFAQVLGRDLWKVATTHKCWLEPKDDKKLSKLLREELNCLRRLHTVREKETNEQIAAITDQLAALPPAETDEAKKAVEQLRERIKQLQNMLRGEFTTYAQGERGSSKLISIFKVPLGMVRHGWGGLREKLLEREWAEHFGLNLKTIPTEAAAFRTWIERLVYNARQTTANLNTRTVEIGVGLNLYPWQWEILEAAVLYEIRFADGARCWLDDIEERGVTDPQEVEDFEKLEEAKEIAGDERMTLDQVCGSLLVKWKGESRPMGHKGLQKLCEKVRVPFKFPMRRNLVRKLDEHRKRQTRKRDEQLKRHTAKVMAQKPL